MCCRMHERTDIGDKVLRACIIWSLELGMSEYHGSEGFDRPPLDVYSYGGGYFGDLDGAGA